MKPKMKQKKKPFNKAEALKGAPVVLRNGAKAFVKFEIAADQLINSSNIRDALHGYIVGPLNIAEDIFSWKEDGRVWTKSENELDIIGMWEELRQKVTITIPKPLFMPPEGARTYFKINSEMTIVEIVWTGNKNDKATLENGMAFATREDAERFLKAMRHARA